LPKAENRESGRIGIATAHAKMGMPSKEILIWDYWPNGQWVVAVPSQSSLDAVCLSD